MLRLLTSLFSSIKGLLGKPGSPEFEFEDSSSGNPRGAFLNQVHNPLELYIDILHNEEEDFDIRVQYMCACGLPVYKLLIEDYGFGCSHCDSLCHIPFCEICDNLAKVDFGAPDA